MEELVEQTTVEATPEPKRNRGWFRPADSRINREGRPRGSLKDATREGRPVGDRAPQSDRLKVLTLRMREVAHRLTHRDAFWIVNLPADFEIVASRLDTDENAVAFIIRSAAFPMIAKGALIPEFAPEFHGLRWKLTRGGPAVSARM
jgi:hypothetical protein